MKFQNVDKTLGEKKFRQKDKIKQTDDLKEMKLKKT